jgi:two-component sensor histidine kinase/TPR repeat protein
LSVINLLRQITLKKVTLFEPNNYAMFLRRVYRFLLVLSIIAIPSITAAQIRESATALKMIPPAQSKTAWQRLLLQLSSTFITVVNENQIDLDSSLVNASISLGLSRLPVVAEGINDPQLLAKSFWVDKGQPNQGLKLLNSSSGNTHLELLLLIGSYYAFRPDGYSQAKDSAVYFLNRAEKEGRSTGKPELSRIALCLLGKIYVTGKDLELGNKVFDQLIKECRQAGDERNLARAMAFRGLYTAYSPQTTGSRINDLNQAAHIYDQLNDKENEINTITNLCYLHFASGHSDMAHQFALQALSLEHETGFPYTQYNTDLITSVTQFTNKFAEPFRNIVETLKTAQAAHDSIGWGYFYSQMGIFYRMGGKDSVALMWYRKAVQFFLSHGKNHNLFVPLTNLSIILGYHHPQQALEELQKVAGIVSPKTPAEIFIYEEAYFETCLRLKRFDLAYVALNKADASERQLEKWGFPFHRAAFVAMTANFYFEKEDFVKAKTYYKKFLTISTPDIGGLFGQSAALSKLIYIDSVSGDKDGELKNRRLYTQLSDANFQASETRQAEEMQVEYATEEKENQIALLNQKDKLEQANLKQANLIRDITIGFILLTIAVIALLFKQNRQKQKSNKVLGSLVTEKEWLLKEVHHRVKNNLHTIICLLESQADYLKGDALLAIENSQHRIYAMSLIHQKLYQSDNIKVIDMKAYLAEFMAYLRKSFGSPKNIDIILNIEAIELDISQAIPVGLILNEAVNNAFKYAFPKGRKGDIVVAMCESGDRITLTISDNGVGIQQDLNTEPGSLGLELMHGLAKDIRGNIKFENKQGTRITLEFVLNTIGATHVAV